MVRLARCKIFVSAQLIGWSINWTFTGYVCAHAMGKGRQLHMKYSHLTFLSGTECHRSLFKIVIGSILIFSVWLL